MAWKQLELTDDDRYALRTLEKKTRFLVDENMHNEVARFLRARGWNVKSVGDLELRGHSDEDVLAFAHREDRILLTHDRDFLSDRQFPPNRNPGVVILPGANGSDERLVGGLMDLLVTLAPYQSVRI
jgi:predicted nuclease of predicted toxin-antitoxin system